MTPSVDDPNQHRWLQLSALCDGEADAAEAQSLFEGWRDDAVVRARWHSYQWIGDVMRSDDLASAADHDQAFLLALRERLAKEPVVLAPARVDSAVPAAMPVSLQVAAAGGRRQRWGAPMAMAAGVMVTGALVVMSSSGPQPPVSSAPMAQQAPTDAQTLAAAPSVGASAVQVGNMLRNPELDRYLNAHRQFVQGSTLSVPGGVRQVAVTPDGH
jgi:sigma-E factor negative regulatory protein RseA